MKTIKKIGNNGNNIGKNTSEKVIQALTNKSVKIYLTPQAREWFIKILTNDTNQ
ncbi:hypothetical protein HPK02_05470 [Anoxybacillus flavithermus]|uniref:hypothetical protein n=1 Tax=Anoxybacillus flavithermus TaxID=33934 RepID=UPI001868195E|nr:hypothetical protein [Anoxybacillus flavithermus]MBE2918352.1 hypothetical protein [Anoxybacillus flavithermus]